MNCEAKLSATINQREISRSARKITEENVDETVTVFARARAHFHLIAEGQTYPHAEGGLEII